MKVKLLERKRIKATYTSYSLSNNIALSAVGLDSRFCHYYQSQSILNVPMEFIVYCSCFHHVFSATGTPAV